MIDDLTHTPPAVVEEARRLSGLQRITYLWSQVEPETRPYLDRFVQDVVDGDMPPQTWGRRGVLVPELSLQELVTLSVADVVAPLGAEGRTSWQQLDVAEAPGPPAVDPYVGAPALARDDLRYDWNGPPTVTRFAADSVRLRPVAGLVLAVRRWMAHRLAIEVGFDSEVMSRTEAVAARAGVDPGLFSRDALVALRGLAEETRKARPGAGGIPGFRGPDSLYE